MKKKVSRYKMQDASFYLQLFFFFLLVTCNLKLATIVSAQQIVFSPGSPAPWDNGDVEPGAVIKDGSLFKMWFTGSDGKKYRIGYAVSKDGVNWDRHAKPVFEHGEEDKWDSFSTAYPSVIKDRDIYKMWYTGSSGKKLSIGYAVSKDGISWERNEKPVFEPDEEDVWDGFSVLYPMVIKENNKYKMFYTGTAGISYKIGIAVSDDGINWKRAETNPINLGEKVHSFHPWVIKDLKNGYRMWYSIKESPKTGFKIGFAISKDGINWDVQKEALKPYLGWDIKEVFKPVVLQEGNKYKMWYAGFDGRKTRIGIAESIDSIKWTRHGKNPVFNASEGAGWDGDSIFGGSIIKDGDVYNIWYSGFNGNRTRIGLVSSKNEINWQKNLTPVFLPGNDWDRMGVGYPHVIKDNNIYKMWHTGFDGTILQVGYAISKDGINWQRRDKPVLKPGKGWDKVQTAYPFVLKDKNGYRMYYSGYDGKKMGIGIAVSKDGIKWKRLLNKPVIEDKEIISPWVIRDKDGYKMWYSVYGDNGYEIHSASSIDGIKWTKHGAAIKPDGKIKDVKGAMVIIEDKLYNMYYEEFDGFKNHIAQAFSRDGKKWERRETTAIDPGPKDGWDSYGVAGAWVLKENGIYKMWYSGHDGITFRIGSAVSKDGINWERLDTPVFDIGTSGSWDDAHAAYPFVMKDGNLYKMWYYGFGSSPKHPPSIGYATSIDGINWERYDANPVLSPGETGSWDDEMLGYPVIIKEGKIYKMWYAGANVYEKWQIGYAESKDGVKWTKFLAPALVPGEKDEWDGFAVSYPMVISVKGGYYMWYTGIDARKDGSAMRIGLAYSKDGISWDKGDKGTKPALEPQIDIGGKGEWNEASSFSPRVMLDKDVWKIWFTGFDAKRIFRIGYTEKRYEGLLENEN